MSDEIGSSIPASTLADAGRRLLSEGLEYAFRIGLRMPDVLLERYSIERIFTDLAGRDRALFANMFRSLFKEAPPTIMSCGIENAVSYLERAAHGSLDNFRTVFADPAFTLRADIFVEAIGFNDVWLFLILGEIHHDQPDLSGFFGNEESADALIRFLVGRARAHGIVTDDHVCTNLDAVERISIETLRSLVGESLLTGTPIRVKEVVDAVDLEKVFPTILWSKLLLPLLGIRRAASSSPMRAATPYFPPVSPLPAALKENPFLSGVPYVIPDDALTDAADDGDEVTQRRNALR